MKYVCLGILVLVCCVPIFVSAQESGQTFIAEVSRIVDQKSFTTDAGNVIVQQVLLLHALDGSWVGQDITFDGTQYQVIGQNTYAVGDRVSVIHNRDVDGDDQFFIVDYIRTTPLYWLAGVFAVIVVAVGRLKGVRALIVLALSFLVILEFIIPRIVAGASPLWISIVGTLGILIMAILLTEGVRRDSWLSIISICVTLLVTGLLAVWFTRLTKLTGFASEEATYLTSLTASPINIQGLLLAGIIIGALGVLDDVAVSQTALVRELRIANPTLSVRELYRRGMRVGISHMGSMVNTLFFAYAGAALPLLVLFSAAEVNAPSFTQAINNEVVATEIIRTLVGSVGLILMVPITTALAVWFGDARLFQPQQGSHHQDANDKHQQLED